MSKKSYCRSVDPTKIEIKWDAPFTIIDHNDPNSGSVDPTKIEIKWNKKTY